MRDTRPIDRLAQVQYQGKVSFTRVIDDFKAEIQACHYPFRNSFTECGTMVFDLRNIMSTMMSKRFVKRYMPLIVELGEQIAALETHDNMLRIKMLDAAFTTLRRSVHRVTTYAELVDMMHMFTGMTHDRLACALMVYSDSPDAAFTVRVKCETGQVFFEDRS